MSSCLKTHLITTVNIGKYNNLSRTKSALLKNLILLNPSLKAIALPSLLAIKSFIAENTELYL